MFAKKIKKWFFLFGILLLIGGSVFVLREPLTVYAKKGLVFVNFDWLKSLTGFHPQQVSLTEKISSRSRLDMHSSAYYFQWIFPYDFVSSNVNWEAVKEDALYDENSATFPKLPEERKKLAKIWHLGEQLGWDWTKHPEYFIVLSGTIKLGYCQSVLESWLMTLNTSENMKELKWPPLEVVSFELTLLDQKEMGFSDPPLDLAWWQNVSTKLSELVYEEILVNEKFITLTKKQTAIFFESFYEPLDIEMIQWSIQPILSLEKNWSLFTGSKQEPDVGQKIQYFCPS